MNIQATFGRSLSTELPLADDSFLALSPQVGEAVQDLEDAIEEAARIDAPVDVDHFSAPRLVTPISEPQTERTTTVAGSELFPTPRD